MISISCNSSNSATLDSIDEDIIEQMPGIPLSFALSHVEAATGETYKLYGMEESAHLPLFAAVALLNSDRRMCVFDAYEDTTYGNLFFAFMMLKSHNNLVGTFFSVAKEGTFGEYIHFNL